MQQRDWNRADTGVRVGTFGRRVVFAGGRVSSLSSPPSLFCQWSGRLLAAVCLAVVTMAGVGWGGGVAVASSMLVVSAQQPNGGERARADAQQRIRELYTEANARIRELGLDPGGPEARAIRDEIEAEVRAILEETRRIGEAGVADRGAAVVGAAAGGAQVGGAQVRGAVPPVAADEEFYEISALAQPVSLTVLIDLIRLELELPLMILDPAVSEAQVVIASDLRLPRRGLIDFLQLMLDTQGFALTFDEGTGLYLVQRADIAAAFGSNPLTPTQFIDTGSIPASLIQPLVDSITRRGPGAAGGGAAVAQIQYIDSLNLIVATASPQRIANIRRMVEELRMQQSRREFMSFPLRHIAPSVAIERLAQLEGSGQGGVRRSTAGAGTQAGAVAAATGATGAAAPASPLAAGGAGAASGGGGGITLYLARLSIDPAGNGLIMFGLPEERTPVENLLAIIDRPSELRSDFYAVGTRAARLIAESASSQGLGPVTEASGEQSRGGFGAIPTQPRLGGALGGALGGQSVATQAAVGSGFVLYPEAGGFDYRGTDAQHEQVRAIINRLSDRIRDEEIVYEFYKLRHTLSDDVAGIVQSLVTSSQGSATSPLLPGSLGRGATTPAGRTAAAAANPDAVVDANAAIEASDDVFILSDPQNNQVVVRAPKRLQPQFGRLIRQLDLRRPQVYIEAQIISVTNTDQFRLAVETQILAGQFGLQTNLFGLSTPGASFQDPRSPATGLAGLTSALIKSQYVPIVINAIQQNTDARIVSSPQLLVDDNVEASIVSLDQQPTTTTTIGQTSDQTAFAGFQDAGTTLRVTPRISEGGYLRLTYEIELSNFVGEGSGGVPGPRQQRTVSSESVTIPSDATIVVGGLITKDKSRTVIKVPLLGDIPLVGELFRSTVNNETEGVLYVFLTPRIMRDANFVDLRLLTEGPLAMVDLPPDFPPAMPVSIPILGLPSLPRWEYEPGEGGLDDDEDSVTIGMQQRGDAEGGVRDGGGIGGRGSGHPPSVRTAGAGGM